MDVVKTLVLLVVLAHVVVSLPVNKHDQPLRERTSRLTELFPQYMFCEECKYIVNLAITTIASNETLDYFKKDAICICKYINTFLNYRGDVMCPGLIDAYGPVVLFVAANLLLDPVRTCRELNFCEPTLSSITKSDHKQSLWLDRQDFVDSVVVMSQDVVDNAVMVSQDVVDSDVIESRDVVDSDVIESRDVVDSSLTVSQDVVDSAVIENRDVVDSPVIASRDVVNSAVRDSQDARDSAMMKSQDVIDSLLTFSQDVEDSVMGSQDVVDSVVVESQDALDIPMTESQDRLQRMTLDRQETSLFQFNKEPIKTHTQHDAGSSSSDPIRIVQIADIHLDRLYTEGSPTECRMNICCRRELSGTGSAGKFGDYNCDVPMRTVEAVLSHIAALDPQPDFVIYTGDAPPHDTWEESWFTQLNADLHVINTIKSYLPGIPVYPVLGNHESFPQSEYYQPHQEYKTLNINTAEWWQQLFDIPADQLRNIQYSAYYTALVQPRLRILAINTDYWYSLNFYSLLNHKVPAYREQLKFIDATLRNASEYNEKVIIAGHIPPGDFWVHGHYGDILTEITNKYADVIVMNVFSHTHHDEFELITDPNDPSRPSGVVFIAPSVTTQARTNPSHRVYQLDRETFHVMDYDQYYINLTKANAEGVATLQLSYSARSEYDIPDLSPQSLHSLVNRFATDRSLFDRYRRNKYVQSGQGRECCFLCRHEEICRMSSIATLTYYNCLLPFL
ncbi:sphingomyelin phosphodiesterase A-like [Haliotis rubra]|uniref:sphingomyelin phosphodiesterase A-like n=1 Tax=Haliotis rubra TaxID=36100 RepID=UPI001EE5EBAD|nr:sphingomyelin phosphodiesterase A-like [Haliotis rubra]